ncbi:MAG: hypothetical protein MR419_08850 [Clostridiales bacterium]|nr:hypothetical protein [Clostridiales bacterium]MDY4171376.1 hypothetical protein [Evtepia sp.]
MKRDDARNARHRCAKGTAFSNESFSFEKRITLSYFGSGMGILMPLFPSLRSKIFQKSCYNRFIQKYKSAFVITRYQNNGKKSEMKGQ